LKLGIGLIGHETAVSWFRNIEETKWQNSNRFLRPESNYGVFEAD
jgi:hypothetical protein